MLDRFFVNIVNNMSDSVNPKKIDEIAKKNSQFLESGIFVKEDDQDWGSSGMNDIQSDAE